MTLSNGRMIVVSNRLPVSMQQQGGGTRMEPSSGGLATALSSIWGSQTDGVWIGWPGKEPNWETEALLAKVSQKEPYELQAITLDEHEVSKFYAGFANEIIWPLFHDLQSRCNFNPEYWDVYQRVNRKFAKAVEDVARPEDLVWVHDYHLMLVAQHLRESGLRSRLAFFLHIPFPPPEVFEKLPWREPVLRALLDFDLLGFQTEHDRTNFLSCVTRLLPEIKIEDQVGQPHKIINLGSRRILVGAFPISIDFDEFAQAAAEEEIATRTAIVRSELMENIVVLGVDRLDYTKGIPERLQAFRILLERHPELLRQITLVQLVVPSRAEIPEYQGLRQEVELLVSEINGRFTQGGWVPIHYMYRSLPRKDVLAYYRAADIALITPLKDGMNLVAKEFCAAQVDERGVLILSEFAGASPELRHGALLVNPNDFVGVAEAIYQASQMPADGKRERMRLLREIVRNHNVQRWSRSFLDAAKSPEIQTTETKNGNDVNEPPRSKVPGVALLASPVLRKKQFFPGAGISSAS